MFVVAALYHFFDFTDYVTVRPAVKAQLLKLGVKGTLLLTPEGINGTIAGTRGAVDAILVYLRKEIIGSEFEHKESLCEYQPFLRTKVKLKKETISIGKPAPVHKRGTWVDAQEWNTLIADPETILIDARNSYEVEKGTFANAIDPKIRTFKQLPAYVEKHLSDAKQKKIASFCTGGIRCEKFTAWLVEQGYEHVYHLKGGILKYIEEIPVEESKWQGECFVFDDRIAVDHALLPAKNNTEN